MTVDAWDEAVARRSPKCCSMAALTGLHSGDVINRVDERPIRTPIELATELSKRVAGDKVRLGYLIRGQWESETIVTLGQSSY